MVASYSPHRHHGETATLFSTQHGKSPSRHHMLRSPTSCSSPFAIPLPSSVKTRSSTRRVTPLKSRGSSTAPVSPVKFPLSLTTTSHMNSGGMTLRSGSSSPRSSPREKAASQQRQARAGAGAGAGMENGPQARASTGSPLKRSDGIMNLDQASRGSPVAKRRSQFGLFSAANNQHTFGSPSFGSPPTTSSISTTPKRHANAKKTPGHLFGVEKPSFVRSRPQIRPHEFITPSDPASKIRRVASIDNFQTIRRGSIGTGSSLPNASIHPHLGSNIGSHATNPSHPHPLSQTQNTFSSQGSGYGSVDSSSQTSSEWRTPQNFRFAKPNPAAFHSTGFVPKRGRLMHADKDHGPQPDTPCKRPNNAFSSPAFRPEGGARLSMTDFGNISTPFSNSGGGVKLGFGTLDRMGSTLSNDDESDHGQSQSSADYDLPPTPTKKVYSNLGGIFNGTKRVRTEQSSDDLRVRYSERFSPQTPKDNIVPPDPSSLSISGRAATFSNRNSLPATPARDFFTPPFDFAGSSSSRQSRMLLTLDGCSVKVSEGFVSRFSEVKHIGSGEFSEVYQVTEGRPRRNAFIASLNPSTPHQLATPKHSSPFGSSPTGAHEPPLKTYAVKKSKSQFFGSREKDRRLEEVQILKKLGRSDHVVEFVDSWDEGGYLYIQTEFCDNGSLDKFLEHHGDKGRLDEFRVWKVLLELCSGLQHIHDSGFIHLDLKPANVLITFDGALKISDFGMATRWPASRGLEREGDREYIAPEVLESQKYDKPVDIFALGLTIVEAAGNEALPPNGPEWQSLRSGDISVAPILSTSSSGELVVRDEEGNPISTVMLENDTPPPGIDDPDFSKSPRQRSNSHRSARASRTDPALLHRPRPGDLVNPPTFMVEGGLEEIVKWMISANPVDRPTVSQLLEAASLRWVDSRRRAPATIFEGLWGPDDLLIHASDEEDEMAWETPDGDSSVWA